MFSVAATAEASRMFSRGFAGSALATGGWRVPGAGCPAPPTDTATDSAPARPTTPAAYVMRRTAARRRWRRATPRISVVSATPATSWRIPWINWSSMSPVIFRSVPGPGAFNRPGSRDLTQAGQPPRGGGLDGADGAPEHLGGLRLAELLPVAQHQHRPLPRRQHGQRLDECLPQVQYIGTVRLAWRLHLGQDLRSPLAASPLVDREVVQRAAQIRLPVAADPAPVAHQSLQRRLQQILSGGATAGEQYRRREQGTAAFNDEGVQPLEASLPTHGHSFRRNQGRRVGSEG